MLVYQINFFPENPFKESVPPFTEWSGMYVKLSVDNLTNSMWE